MELPTYTNIWKIEKRLYKLYDFRLPMPLPVGQIAAFLAIAVPYTLILTVVGMPFSHTWLWLYVLPPGALAWLVTRPVLEGKRLPELVLSQLRYVTEPRAWCRLAPIAERDQIVVFARVWRSASATGPQLDAPTPGAVRQSAPAQSALAQPAPAQSAQGADSAEARQWPTAEPGWTRRPVRQPAKDQPARDQAAKPAVIRVTSTASQARPLNVVERALRTSPTGGGWREPVVVVPGGHRPGKPDHVQRDQARARQPLSGPARIVVLGCTAGAGQTTAALLTGQLLVSLRGAAVALLDLGTGGSGSLTERARTVTALLPSRATAGGRGLQVITATDSGDDADQIINSVVARYPLTIADPDAGRVPKALRAADQLVVVAPASAAASSALAMTFEWLDANGFGQLGAMAVTVLNGVSPASAQHVDTATAVVSGRCRAVIRVPWDERLGGAPAAGLGAATVQAYTALAGVTVAALAARRAAVPGAAR